MTGYWHHNVVCLSVRPSVLFIFIRQIKSTAKKQENICIQM